MSEEEIKIYYDHIDKLLNGGNKKTYGFAPQTIKNILNFYEKLKQENTKLKSDIEELNLIVGIRQKRNLIRKFDKEYDEEDKKKNPNRDYACITPDAEVVYERYYQLKSVLKEIRESIMNFLLTEEYIIVDGKAIANNYHKLLEIIDKV